MLVFISFLVFCTYIFLFYLCHDAIGKNFVHTSGIHIIILACFHMYMHVGTRVHIDIYVCVREL